MRLYHTTHALFEILDGGFEDGESDEYPGVWVADSVVNCEGGAKGADVLFMEVPEEVLSQYEETYAGRDYRVFVVPAAVLNEFEIMGCFSANDEDHFIKLMSEPCELSLSAVDHAAIRCSVIRCQILARQLLPAFEMGELDGIKGFFPERVAKQLDEDLTELAAHLDSLLENKNQELVSSKTHKPKT